MAQSGLAFNAHWKAVYWLLVLTLQFTAGWTKHLTFTEVVSVEKDSQKEKVQFRGRKVEEHDFSGKSKQAFSIPLTLTFSLTLSSCSCF